MPNHRFYKTRYPYEQWISLYKQGHLVKLQQGKDFSGDPELVAYNIRRQAKLRDVQLSCLTTSTSVTITSKIKSSFSRYSNKRDGCGTKYPWHLWLNGKPQKLIYGQDYSVTSETIRRAMHRYMDKTKPHYFKNKSTHILLLGYYAPEIPRNRNQDRRK
jgi:hypothetical protein